MKYILYTIVTRTPEGFNVSCSKVPSTLAAYMQLRLIGANILAIDLTAKEAANRALQHGLAVDALAGCSN